MTAPAASLLPPRPSLPAAGADPERLPWLTGMIAASRPGPMDQEARDRARAEAAAIIASGTCPDPFNHRLHAFYLTERCLACGGDGPLPAAGTGTATADMLRAALNQGLTVLAFLETGQPFHGDLLPLDALAAAVDDLIGTEDDEDMAGGYRRMLALLRPSAVGTVAALTGAARGGN
jgi:hypothetical protein